MCFTKNELIFINDMQKKKDVTKMIQIPKTKEMVALVDKYLNYGDTHFGTNEDIERSKLLKPLVASRSCCLLGESVNSKVC